MYGGRFVAAVAALILLGLPVADFCRDGQVADGFVGALLVLVFGGAGFTGDRALRERLRSWVNQEEEERKE